MTPYRDADVDSLQPFNLMPYQHRILKLVTSRAGVTSREILEKFGSWNDLMIRGLVKEHGGLVYATEQANAFLRAINALGRTDS